MKKLKKIAKYALLLFTIFAFSYVLYIGISAGFNWKKMSAENPNNAAPFFKLGSDVKPSDLKGEGDGRINILLLGYGGAGHDGAYATDTIQVVSIDPQNKQAAMLSIPRDLYVKVPGYGMSKINAAFASGYNEYMSKSCKSKKVSDCKSDALSSAANLSVKTVSALIDLPVHYYLSVDFDGFTKIIDQLGGIQVNVEHSFTDNTYPVSECNEAKPDTCATKSVSFKAGLQTMDGSRALIFTRSRHSLDNGEGTDFARSRRQQLVMEAAKSKALSAGVLLNPAKLTNLMSTAGDHVKTDLSLSNIQSLSKFAKDFDSSNIVNKVLDYDNVLAPADGSSNIIPKNNDYSLIKEFAHGIFSDPYIAREKASIIIKNGSGTAGYAEKLKQQLVEYGYNVTGVEKTDKTIQTVIYDYSKGKKPFTASYLSKRLNASVLTGKAGQSKADIEIILGNDYKPNTEAKGSSPEMVSSNEKDTVN